jgi:hypothetical protein
MRQVSAVFLTVAIVSAMLLSGCAENTTPPAHVYAMGEKAAVGPVLYTVFETQWLTHLGAPPDEKVPQNRFFLVRIAAVNGGGSDVMLPTMTLEDDKGQSYSEVTTDVGAPQWLGVLRTVHPADSTTGNLVFDCPPAHYTLHINDDLTGRSAIVDIPLTFNSESQDIPLPKK